LALLRIEIFGFLHLRTSTASPEEKKPMSATEHRSIETDPISPARGYMLEELKQQLGQAAVFCRQQSRPFVAVTYAQSLDGSIASRSRRQLSLSGDASMNLTHELRGCFDAILVGIGTVLSDDPRLTVRRTKSRHPQPVILDTHLRTPTDCNLVRRRDTRSWIIGGPGSRSLQQRNLEKAGAEVMRCAVAMDGRIELAKLMALLVERNICSLMVEGGSRVITSFINAQIVDWFVITLAPRLIGGLNAIDERGLRMEPGLSLKSIAYQQLEKDLVVWARPQWNER
jgi:3,4-dihydroxy 2-butanone 4-phosphate synthase/GTP cyclohydrolase II